MDNSRGGKSKHHSIENSLKTRKTASKTQKAAKQRIRDIANEEHDLTKKEKLEARKKAYSIWALTEKTATYIRLANETKLSVKQLKHYKKKDKWEERYKADKASGKFMELVDKEAQELRETGNAFGKQVDEIQVVFDRLKLTERERLFVLHYLKTFNITQAAINAGYAKTSAHTKGNVIFKRSPIQDAVKEIRAIVSKEIVIQAHDILNEYISIAFADITNYLSFDEKGITLKDSNQVDGRLIQEVKQGKDGVNIKLVDKMKALDKLEKLFEIIPDRRLELDRDKFNLTKELAGQDNGTNNRVVIVNDIGSI